MSKKKYIRFVDSRYDTLFHLPDGGRIRLTYRDGSQAERVCRFVDEMHLYIGTSVYHIHECAEIMERNGTKLEPLDYIRDVEFYSRRFLAANKKGRGTPYYIIDETDTHGFAFAPKGAAKGQKYCIFEKSQDGMGPWRVGEILDWGGTVTDIRPQDWGFDVKKIKAITQRPKTKSEPER